MTNPKDIVGQSKASTHCIPPVAILEMGAALHFGAYRAKRADGGEGYGPFNWREQELRMNIYTDALMRHYLAFMDGDDCADDSKASHLGHIMACCAIILDAMENGTMIDTRSEIAGSYNKVASRIRDQNLERAAAIMEAMANDPVDEGDLSQGTWGKLAAPHTREGALNDGRSAIHKPWPNMTPDHIENCFVAGEQRHPHCPGAAHLETSVLAWMAGACNGQLAAHGLVLPEAGYEGEAAKYGYILQGGIIKPGHRVLTPSPLLKKHVLEICFTEQLKGDLRRALCAEDIILEADNMAHKVLGGALHCDEVPREEWKKRIERYNDYSVPINEKHLTASEIHDLAIKMLHSPRGGYIGLKRQPAAHDSAAWTGKESEAYKRGERSWDAQHAHAMRVKNMGTPTEIDD